MKYNKILLIIQKLNLLQISKKIELLFIMTIIIIKINTIHHFLFLLITIFKIKKLKIYV